jgi:hypothetical protein
MRKILCLIVLFGLWAVPALAQRTTGAIRGTVTDTTGAVVPGADVTAKSETTGFSRSMVTNAEGVYAFEELPVGTYTVSVSLSGFKAAVQTGIPLNVADTLAVNVQLQPGAISETITVESSTTTVKTVGGEVAGLVTGEQVRQLPLNGRNFLQLGTLMPGVSAGDGFNTKDRGLMSSISVSVSGAGYGSNLWTVDGANNNDVGSNRTILVYPSVDAIEEFKIQRSTFGAEFGRSSAIVNTTLRRGTNGLHGSVFDFWQNREMNATDFFLNRTARANPPLNQHNFGTAVGGPVRIPKLYNGKNRTFWFFNYEGTRQRSSAAATALYPSRAQLEGNLADDSTGTGILPRSSGFCQANPSARRCVDVLDPFSGLVFPNNVIPANRR